MGWTGQIGLSKEGINNLVDYNVNNTVFVDASFGSDATGQRENAKKPFATLQAAETAANSGDLIHVRPGLYLIGAGNSLVRDDLGGWYFDKGASILTDGVADAWNVVAGFGQLRLYGYLNLTLPGTSIGFNASGFAGPLSIQMNDATLSGSALFSVLSDTVTRNVWNFNMISSSSNTGVFILGSCDLDVYGNVDYTGTSNAVLLTSTGPGSVINWYGNGVTSNGGFLLHTSGATSRDKVNWYGDITRVGGGGLMAFTTDFIEMNVFGDITGDVAMFTATFTAWDNLSVYGDMYDGFLNCTAGRVRIRGNMANIVTTATKIILSASVNARVVLDGNLTADNSVNPITSGQGSTLVLNGNVNALGATQLPSSIDGNFFFNGNYTHGDGSAGTTNAISVNRFGVVRINGRVTNTFTGAAGAHGVLLVTTPTTRLLILQNSVITTAGGATSFPVVSSNGLGPEVINTYNSVANKALSNVTEGVPNVTAINAGVV